MINFEKSAQKEMEKTRDIILGFPWEDREAYGMWLVQTYHMVNHSTRLVALAGALTSLEKNDLHARFVDHSKEERGHQMIAISDLKALGYSVSDFPCLYQSAAMYQVQYYWIQHRDPSSFFGYTLALECLAGAFGSELNRRTSKAHGEKAAKFLKVHSEDDLEHIDKALKMLNALPVEEGKLVQENLELSASLYRGMLVEIQMYLAKLKEQKAA